MSEMTLLSELTKRDIRAVIFDLDDTLYPEIQYVKSGFRVVGERIKRDYGIECVEVMSKLFNDDKNDVYKRVLEQYGINCGQNYIDELVVLYREHTPVGLNFFSDVRPFLKKIKAFGIKTGIITDGRI